MNSEQSSEHLGHFKRVILCLGAFICGMAWGLQTGPAIAADEPVILAPTPGQPGNIAPNAYTYRAGASEKENAPESEMLFSILKHDRSLTLCGLLWEEPRPVRRVVLTWPESAQAIPKPNQIELHWCHEGTSASWWCRSGKGTEVQRNRHPQVEDNGHRYVYDINALTDEDAIDQLVVVARDKSRPVKEWSLPDMQVLVPQTWQPMELDIEWGYEAEHAKQSYDGSVEVYNGVLKEASPLTRKSSVTMTDARSWKSPSNGSARRGIHLSLLTLGYQDTTVWPGQAHASDANRTIITVRTESGSFSFLPADLEKGPILANEFGFYVSQSRVRPAAEAFVKQWVKKKASTRREQIRLRPDQTFAAAMEATHGKPQGDWPGHAEPKQLPTVELAIPEPHLAAMWKGGPDQILHSASQNDQGHWRFKDFPYDTLAAEVHQFLRTLDRMGLHQAAQDGYEMWLTRSADPVPLPDGMWRGEPAHFFSGIEWDNAHCGGISLIHLGMLDHYRMTGDREWLTRHLPQLNANIDWILSQREQALADVPRRDEMWLKGLLPPHNIWDNRVWRSWYESNATYCAAVLQHAEVLASIDPQLSERYAREGAAFRDDLMRSVERSLTLSPVIRCRDGSYHSFVPAAPYIRGTASRFMPTNFSVPEIPMHSPGLYADAIRGGQELVARGLLNRDDPRVQGYIDVLEDRMLSDNFKLYMRYPDYNAERDWFTRGGMFYQCGLEQTQNLHLLTDRPACAIRTLLNQFAIEVIPQSWTFREHTAMHSCLDKPFEGAAFLERLRNLLIREDGSNLFLGQAIPRQWLAAKEGVNVSKAPTHFGPVTYSIQAAADQKSLTAKIQLAPRPELKRVRLRLRHPQSWAIRSVTINQKSYAKWDAALEEIEIAPTAEALTIIANY